MSTKYSGGFITKSPVAPTTSAASGIWTLDQQQQAQKAGTWPSPPIFIEDLFSTYLYTGTGATQTITNGINESGNGALTWIKSRTSAQSHILNDTVRGAGNNLLSDSTSASLIINDTLTAFGSTGFTLGVDSNGVVNASGQNFVSWTFREQPKFFDIVTWTGNGVAGRQITHNLGSAPGCILVKSTSGNIAWQVYHRSIGATDFLVLNTTAAKQPSISPWNNTEPTSSVFTVGDGGGVNLNGAEYVAYLFAHNAGGFPVSGGGSTNGISCGSYTGTGAAGNNITLGYEPQWVMLKRTDSTGGWFMHDVMRGMPLTNSYYLTANTSGAETEGGIPIISPTATGFQMETGIGSWNASGGTYIYIAIRRGPMKTPTVGTSVFVPQVVAESTTPPNYLNTITSNFPVDWVFTTTSATSRRFGTRLMGTNILASNSTAAQTDYGTGTVVFDSNISAGIIGTAGSAMSAYMYAWRRAPGFMDVVCYTGTGSTLTLNHNLGVVPELMIGKSRSASGTNWAVYTASQGVNSAYLNRDIAFSNNSDWSTAPTATQFTVPSGADLNISSQTQVMYLFATCAGVSKVGTYTGTGALLTVNCGFTSGARFVLIKRTDSTGDWFTYDSARGITSGNDPYLLLNSTAAEVTGTNYVDTISSGFQVTAAAPAGLNANGGTYLFLAIA